jgi:ribonucleoside-diphosphate reductase alpha chain
VSDLAWGKRRRLTTTHNSITHDFDVAGFPGVITAGLYDDGTVGEIFVKMSKEGSTIGGFCNSWARAFSMMLQLGMPFAEACEKFTEMGFEPSGHTTTKEIGRAKSIVDYAAKWLALRFRPADCGKFTIGEAVVHPFTSGSASPASPSP